MGLLTLFSPLTLWPGGATHSIYTGRVPSFFHLCSSPSTVSCALAVGCHQLKYCFAGTQTYWEMKFLGARCSHYCWVGHCFQACSVNSVCVCTYTNTHTYFKTKIRTIGCWLNLLDLTSVSPFSHNEKPHSQWLLEWDNHYLLYPTYRHNTNASTTVSCFPWFGPEGIYHEMMLLKYSVLRSLVFLCVLLPQLSIYRNSFLTILFLMFRDGFL